MTQELVSLTIIMAVAAVSPIVAQLIPGRFIPQTVLLLVTGAALGPYGLGRNRGERRRETLERARHGVPIPARRL